MSFHSYRVVFCAPMPTRPRTPDFGSCSMSYSFKLQGEGTRGSQALSIALQVWAPDKSFLYGPSRHVEHVWAKIPQFHRRLVGWAVQQSHLLLINRWEHRCPFQCGKDYYIFKKNMLGYSMSFHSYRVVFCDPIPKGPRNPDFGSCSMSYSL